MLLSGLDMFRKKFTFISVSMLLQLALTSTR